MRKDRGFYDRGLDVCTIQFHSGELKQGEDKQFYLKELERVLSRLDINSDIVMYSNVLSNLRIGKYVSVPIFFDICLYSVDSDLLVILMRNGDIRADDIRDYLDERKLFYNEVVFSWQEIEYGDNFLIPDICFVRDKVGLEKNLFDSLSKGYGSCCYYPNMEGRFDLEYMTNYCENFIGIDARNIKGMIQFGDKLILLTHRMKKRQSFGVALDEVMEVLDKYAIDCEVCENDQFNLDHYIEKKVKGKNLQWGCKK